MQAFKLNKLFVATALALAFGPGVRVVDAASLCGIPGASQMGMGCGGNTGTADSTLVPNVGAYQNNAPPPPWGAAVATRSPASWRKTRVARLQSQDQRPARFTT
uniref:Uncharacterized protein n=1 Tax=mine drainage metagenome TaxID=410659 RepID=E6PTV7_9ZZZZ